MCGKMHWTALRSRVTSPNLISDSRQQPSLSDALDSQQSYRLTLLQAHRDELVRLGLELPQRQDLAHRRQEQPDARPLLQVGGGLLWQPPRRLRLRQ